MRVMAEQKRRTRPTGFDGSANPDIERFRLALAEADDLSSLMRGSSRPGDLASTILLIDDEIEIVDALSDLLEGEGFRVVSAHDGQEGLEVLRQLPRPDLILLDLMMPRCNGIAFCRAIGLTPRLSTVPIFIMTAHAEAARHVDDHDRDLIDSAASDGRLWTKPFDFDRLVSAIRSRVGVRRHHA